METLSEKTRLVTMLILPFDVMSVDECKKWVHQWCAKLSNKDFKAFQNDESLSFHCFKCNHEGTEKNDSFIMCFLILSYISLCL